MERERPTTKYFVTMGKAALSSAPLPRSNYGIRYTDIVFGPDGDLYITESTGNVERFDGRTGEYRGLFAGGSGGDFEGLAFGPDGNLYVSEDHYVSSSVKRFHGTTGAFLGNFVAPGSGGLNGPRDLIFGPDGNLYVSSSRTDNVLRYSGWNGAFIDEFVSSGSGGLRGPADLIFTVRASQPALDGTSPSSAGGENLYALMTTCTLEVGALSDAGPAQTRFGALGSKEMTGVREPVTQGVAARLSELNRVARAGGSSSSARSQVRLAIEIQSHWGSILDLEGYHHDSAFRTASAFGMWLALAGASVSSPAFRWSSWPWLGSPLK